MKTFVFLSAFFLSSTYFKATTAQEFNRRFEAFINESLTGLPNWMRQNGYVPEPLEGGGTFTLTSKTENGRPFYNLTGEIRNRFYHGGDKNIRALDITANISYLQFSLDLAFGDGENDFIEGIYSLSGSVSDIPVNGEGIFRNAQQRISPLYIKVACDLGVTRDDYFYPKMWWYYEYEYATKYDDFTLEGLNAGQNERHVLPIVESWSIGPLISSPRTYKHWAHYMQQVFAATPIVDIIGDYITPK